ncbi:MAG TPA: acyltransferase, partial [Aquihabitans sp.]|nr:acyltransferase [Aquihabitans sp.]
MVPPSGSPTPPPRPGALGGVRAGSRTVHRPRRGPIPTPRPVLPSAGRDAQRPIDRRSAPVPVELPAPRPLASSAAGHEAVDARPGHVGGLDGLRAVSVAVVVAFHLGWVDGGFLGVDVFFVVSGFLITRLLVAEVERSGSVGLGTFWVRRFRRLVPVLLVVVAAVLAFARWWWPRWRLADLRGDALAALGYVANWRFSWSGESYFDGGLAPSPLRHLWSLAVEEQFYVVWPLVVVVVVAVVARVGGSVRRAVGRVALAGVAASAAWMVVSAGSRAGLSRVYYGTDARVFALCAGAWLACALEGWLTAPASRAARRARARAVSRGAPVGLAGLAVLVVLAREDALVTYRGGFQAAAALSVLVVAGVVAGRGPVVGVLEAPVLRWLGQRSYGIYLWSWPLQVLVEARYSPSRPVLGAVVVVGAVALAAASFALVEEPVRTGRTLWSRERPVGV